MAVDRPNPGPMPEHIVEIDRTHGSCPPTGLELAIDSLSPATGHFLTALSAMG